MSNTINDIAHFLKRGCLTGNGALLPWPFTHLPSPSNFCYTMNACRSSAITVPKKKKNEQTVPLPCFTAYYCIVGVCVPPPNSCLCVVLLADLHVGGTLTVIYSLCGH